MTLWGGGTITIRKVELSLKKEDQYRWIKDYVDHPWKNKLRIALKFSVSLRTVNRWIAGYKKHGKSFFIHGNATLEPDCKISEKIRKKVVELYRGGVYQGSNFAHFTEMLDQYEDIHISEQSVRNILHAAGIHPPKMWRSTKKRIRQEEKQRQKELAQAADTKELDVEVLPQEKNKLQPEDGHSIRSRCKYFGELLQMDASSYNWFGKIISHLHVSVDDCTGRITGAYIGTDHAL